LGLRPNTVIFASTGLVNSTKRLDMALESFARLRQVNPDVFFLIVGGVHSDVNLNQLIRKNQVQKAVKHTGFVNSLQEFSDWTATADVVVNLRNPTLGETSATALRAMAAGKPLIVFDHGWYSEIPDETCLKVDPTDSEALFQAMLDLAEDDDKRVTMGLAARDHIASRHQPDQAAELYITFVQTVLANLGQTV
jgi:glycosyltransferase involved in cell wall biosynthesis